MDSAAVVAAVAAVVVELGPFEVWKYKLKFCVREREKGRGRKRERE